MHELDVAVAGKADRDVVEKGLHFGVDFLQAAVVGVHDDELADFFLAAQEVEGLFRRRHVSHAAAEEIFFVRRDAADVYGVAGVDVHAEAVGRAFSVNRIGQVEGNRVPEQGAVPFVFRDAGPVEADDVLSGFVEQVQCFQDAFDGAESPSRAGHEFDALGLCVGDGFDIAAADGSVAAEQGFVHVACNDFIGWHVGTLLFLCSIHIV